MGLSSGSTVKNQPARPGDMAPSLGRGDPLEDGSSPLQCSRHGKPREQGSLAGCSPEGSKESRQWKQLSTRNTYVYTHLIHSAAQQTLTRSKPAIFQ